MSTPAETAAKLVEGVMETFEADNDTKIAIGGEIFDQLFGTDKHALVAKFPGLTSDMSEQVFDYMKGLLVQKLQEKFFNSPPPPTP